MKRFPAVILLFVIPEVAIAQSDGELSTKPLYSITIGMGIHSLGMGSFASHAYTPKRTIYWKHLEPGEILGATLFAVPSNTLEFDYQPGDVTYAFRAGYSSTPLIRWGQFRKSDTAFMGAPSAPVTRIWELGIMYGRVKHMGLSRISLSLGFSMSDVITPNLGEQYRNDTTVVGYFVENIDSPSSQSRLAAGIIGEVQWIFAPLPFLGIGASAFGSLNTAQSYGSVMIVLQLGKLR